MTLLITVAGKGFLLSATDTRTTVAIGNNFNPVNEYFNKSIIFTCGDFNGCVSFTGLAEWIENSKTIRMYDAVSQSLAESIAASLKIGQLAKKLGDDVLARILSRKTARAKKEAVFEFHINGWHRGIPHAFMCVVSTFREQAPWSTSGAYEYAHHVDGLNVYLKSIEDCELVVGGWEPALYRKERATLLDILIRGAGGFEVSQFISKLIETAASRHQTVGPRSVAVLLPQVGMLDTNVWDKKGGQIVGYVPKVIFGNGAMWEPSEFPVNLNLAISGQLPKHSLFVKSIVAKQFKKSDRRRIFKANKGELIPGIFGFIELALFGSIVQGYSDFGLGDDED